MITQQQIAAAGGDWAEYGELNLSDVVELAKQGKVTVVFANKAVLLGVERADGKQGVYNLPHIEGIENF